MKYFTNAMTYIYIYTILRITVHEYILIINNDLVVWMKQNWLTKTQNR